MINGCMASYIVPVNVGFLICVVPRVHVCKYGRVFVYMYILQAIKFWWREWPGNEARFSRPYQRCMNAWKILHQDQSLHTCTYSCTQ